MKDWIEVLTHPYWKGVCAGVISMACAVIVQTFIPQPWGFIIAWGLTWGVLGLFHKNPYSHPTF